jgi:hypothetical protein
MSVEGRESENDAEVAAALSRELSEADQAHDRYGSAFPGTGGASSAPPVDGIQPPSSSSPHTRLIGEPVLCRGATGSTPRNRCLRIRSQLLRLGLNVVVSSRVNKTFALTVSSHQADLEAAAWRQEVFQAARGLSTPASQAPARASGCRRARGSAVTSSRGTPPGRLLPAGHRSEPRVLTDACLDLARPEWYAIRRGALGLVLFRKGCP